MNKNILNVCLKNYKEFLKEDRENEEYGFKERKERITFYQAYTKEKYYQWIEMN